jgi:hypothetical protein
MATGDLPVVKCGDRCRGRPDDSDHGGHAVGLDYLDRECVGTVDGAGGGRSELLRSEWTIEIDRDGRQ